MRRTPVAALQLALPLAETSKASRVIEAIETAKQCALDLLEPLYRPKPDLSLVETRPDGSPVAGPAFVPPGSHKYVERKGRLRADGTRTPARILRVMRVYLEPLVAEELEAYCAAHDLSLSEYVNEAVREKLDRS